MPKEVVVFLFSLYSRGGLEKVTNVLASELVNRGYKVVYAIDRFDEPHEVFPEKVKVHVFAEYLAPSRRRTLTFVRGWVRSRSKLLELKSCYPNAVYVSVSSLYSAWVAVSANARPLFLWLHGPVEEVFASSRKWIVNKKLFVRVDRLVALSENMRKEIANLLGEKVLRKTFVISNPVSTDVRESLCSPGSKRFVYVGRLSSEKRADRILKAFSRVDNIDWELLIVGDGPEKGNLYDLAQSLGINERIIWAGWQSDPWRYVKSVGGAEALLLTSDYEGFGLVMVEAMANGIPCVAVDCSTGPGDIIQNGINGVLIPFTSDEQIVKDLSQVLKQFLDGKLMFDEDKIKASVVEHDPSMVVEKWIKLIEQYNR